jgi:hypothetical protein
VTDFAWTGLPASIDTGKSSGTITLSAIYTLHQWIDGTVVYGWVTRGKAISLYLSGVNTGTSSVSTIYTDYSVTATPTLYFGSGIPGQTKQYVVKWTVGNVTDSAVYIYTLQN